MLAIGTRFFGKDSGKDLPRLANFLDAAILMAGAGNVYVAVNTEEDKVETLDFVKGKYGDSVTAFAVTPWQKFVPPLNAIVYKTAMSNVTCLLLASAEFPPLSKAVMQLREYLDEDTLVAGARFSEHQFAKGKAVGTGITVPWNTFALWNMKYLPRLGFAMVGDAPFDQSKAGVEELVTVALFQKVYGVHRCQAKLVSVPGFYEEWNTEGWDEERREKHEKKIQSKVTRPAAQLHYAELPAPTVLHI